MLLAVPRFSRPQRIAAAPMRTYGKLSTDQPIGGSRLPEGLRRRPEFDKAKRIKPQTHGAGPAGPRTPPAEARVGVARQGESRLRKVSSGQFVAIRRRPKAPQATTARTARNRAGAPTSSSPTATASVGCASVAWKGRREIPATERIPKGGVKFRLGW